MDSILNWKELFHLEWICKERILPKLSQNLQRIREIAHNSSDLLVNEFVLSGLPAALLCCEGMLSTSTITELILRPIVKIQLEHPTAEQVFQHIQKHQLFSTDRAEALNYRDLFRFFKFRLCGFGFRWLPESVGFWRARLWQTQRFHTLRWK